VTEERTTEDLLSRLGDDLEPVRPIPTLVRQIGSVAAVWVVSALALALFSGMRPWLLFERGASSTLVTLALALVGIGGVGLGLALRIPGREAAARATAVCVGLGALVLGSAAWLIAGHEVGWSLVAGCIGCTVESLGLAFPAAIVAFALALRAAPWRRGAAGVGLAIGAAALGALLVHASCASSDPVHWLVAHALLPLACGVPFGLLAAWAFERLEARTLGRARPRPRSIGSNPE
jgi:hypothetical protein